MINHKIEQIYDHFSEYTMIQKEKYLSNLELINKSNLPQGAIVECGTWKGGMIAGIAKMIGDKRSYYLFDSFEGLPDAKKIDGENAINYQANKNHPKYFDNCKADIKDAEKAMKLSGISNYSIKKGWFEDTLKDYSFPEGISILRLDADWYESTHTILEYLFDQVNQGGLIIIDDYYIWEGCSKAVHDFLSKNKCIEQISNYNNACYIIKKSPSAIDRQFLKINSKPFIVGLTIIDKKYSLINIERFIKFNSKYLCLNVIVNLTKDISVKNLLKNIFEEGYSLIAINDENISIPINEIYTRLIESVKLSLLPDYIIQLNILDYINCKSHQIFQKEILTIPNGGMGLINSNTKYKNNFLHIAVPESLQSSQPTQTINLKNISIYRIPKNSILTNKIANRLLIIFKNKPSVIESNNNFVSFEHLNLVQQKSRNIQRAKHITIKKSTSYKKRLKSDLDEIKYINNKREKIIRNSEIFEDNFHLDNPFIDIPPFRYLFKYLLPKSILDVGCGIGQYLHFAKYYEVTNIKGVDGISPNYSLLNDQEYTQFDLNNGLNISGKFELVMCLEVMEHLTEQRALKIMSEISNLSEKYILFSAAEINQKGIGHINCHHFSYWLQKWDDLGWIPLTFPSLTFRILATFSFFKRNPILLVRKKNVEEKNTQLLLEIGNKRFSWRRQKNGIVHDFLSEDAVNIFKF